MPKLKSEWTEKKTQIIEAYIKRLNRDEASFKRRVGALFNEQKKEVLRRLPNIFLPSSRGLKGIYFNRHEKAIDDVLFNKGEQVAIFIRFEKPLLTKELIDAAEEVFGFTGDEGLFDLQTRRITNYLEKQTKKFATKVNDTTIRELRRELKAGLQESESITDLKDRVEAVYDRATGFRAERMARTELGSGFNFGQQEAYLQSKIVEEKEWVSVIDDRTRGNDPADEFNHIAADGQIVPKNERFEVDGELLMFPRDPAGSAGNVVNCRCRILPVFK